MPLLCFKKIGTLQTLLITTVLSFEKIRAAKDVLYSARYGDIDVEDVERTIRMALP